MEERRATNYPPCPMCPSETWRASSRAEIVLRGPSSRRWVRQFFDCTECRVRARLSRAVDEDTWQFDNRVYN
jgi:hypothetical protein